MEWFPGVMLPFVPSIRCQMIAVLPSSLPASVVCDLNSSNGTFVNGQRLQGCRELQMIIGSCWATTAQNSSLRPAQLPANSAFVVYPPTAAKALPRIRQTIRLALANCSPLFQLDGI